MLGFLSYFPGLGIEIIEAFFFPRPSRSGNILSFLLPLFQEGQLSVTGESMCTKYCNRLGGLSLPRKSVVRLTDRPDMTLDVYRGRKTTMQQQKFFQDLDTLPVSQIILNVFKRTEGEVWKSVSNTGNGYRQDPEMNHELLLGHLSVPKGKKINCKILYYWK